MNRLSGIAGTSVPIGLLNLLKPGRFNEEAIKTTTTYLDTLKKRFIHKMKKARDANDIIASSLDNQLGTRGRIELQNRYENSQLRKVVLERLKLENFVERDTRIIQTYEPGFMKPLSKYGRAHFYAPFKMLGNLQIDTFWFNLAVIWMVSFLLYLALYFKILRRFISFFENFTPRKSEIGRISFVIELPE
jgi:hypothetical protein